MSFALNISAGGHVDSHVDEKKVVDAVRELVAKLGDRGGYVEGDFSGTYGTEKYGPAGDGLPPYPEPPDERAGAAKPDDGAAGDAGGFDPSD